MRSRSHIVQHVSIPYSTIKIPHTAFGEEQGDGVSIPYSTIKIRTDKDRWHVHLRFNSL